MPFPQNKELVLRRPGGPCRNIPDPRGLGERWGGVQRGKEVTRGPSGGRTPLSPPWAGKAQTQGASEEHAPAGAES